MVSVYVSGFLNIRPLSNPNSGPRRQYRVIRYRETLEYTDLIDIALLPSIGEEIIPQVILLTTLFSHTHSRVISDTIKHN